MDSSKRGILYALASAALFGASPPLAKILLGDISPWLLAGLLYLGSGIGLAIARPLLPRDETALRRRDLPWLGGAILFGGVIGPVLLMFGLTQGAAGQSALLLNLESVLTLGLAWGGVSRECGPAPPGRGRRHRRRCRHPFLAVGAREHQHHGRPSWWPAPASPGRSITTSRARSPARTPAQIAMWKGLIAGAVNAAIACAAGARLPGIDALAAAGALGFFSYGLSLVAFVLALRHLGTARTGAYYALAPFIGAAGSILFLAEPITVPFAAGGILMAIGLWLHLTERHLHSHAHEELEHEHAPHPRRAPPARPCTGFIAGTARPSAPPRAPDPQAPALPGPAPPPHALIAGRMPE